MSDSPPSPNPPVASSADLRVMLVSRADGGVGAARAAWRTHRALRQQGVTSVLRVTERGSDAADVIGPRGAAAKLGARIRPLVGEWPNRLQRSANPVLRSTSWLPCRFDQELNRAPVDVVHLHWVQKEVISIEAIGRLRRPLVWTLHDSWAFSGAEHYPADLHDERYVAGYHRHNRPAGERGLDIDRLAWTRKRRHWRQPITIVCPSRWLADCARRSALMAGWPVQALPNPLPTEVYRPWPQALARQLFGLPAEVPLVLFGAIGGGRDPRKGWPLLAEALQRLAVDRPGVEAVVMGQSEPAQPPRLGLPIHWMGLLGDDQSLAMLYSACDLVVVPSRQENLPQSATEAQACGVPVVAFNCTGLPDAVVHERTGYLAQAYDTTDLAHGIASLLADPPRRRQLGEAARQRAERLWSPAVVAGELLRLYRETVERSEWPHSGEIRS
ncbi:MAG: glycosyltransferase [Cyanobacteriota bacterium]|nr:glycosyltransferase [Cyanobacteriota bacterium]